MNESVVSQETGMESSTSISERAPTIRRQLILASLFPLAFFGLLSILVTSVAINQVTLRLALQGSLAEVRVSSDDLSKLADSHGFPGNLDLANVLRSQGIEVGSRLYLVSDNGALLAASTPGLKNPPVSSADLLVFLQGGKAVTRMMISTISGDQAIISYAPLPGANGGVILEEQWTAVLAPGSYYQILLAVLLTLGTILSLYMLSLSIGRVIRPIADMANTAIQAVPGSVFRPLPVQGPAEISGLIKAFNQMVIRLAEQQGALRQYAHKALLSQEEERQRLSHELHDGTVQDLVGLAQRVELCRNELDRDPAQARRRLDELQGLVEQTLGEVRRISNALRPSILEDLGLPVALQALCSDLERQLPSVRCVFEVSGDQHRLSPDVELAVFRVVQEALVNIHKHSPKATLVDVKLNFDLNFIKAFISNDGFPFPGFDLRSQVRTGHLGLAGMYERARLFNGELDIHSEPGSRTTVSLSLPIEADE